MEVRKIFLETNSYSDYFRGDKKITKAISESDEVIISVITLGELYLGFKEGNRESKNLEMLRDFLRDPKVKIANVTLRTSQEYGKMKYELRKRGALIPENDIWIAAQVVETGLVLVTFDKHFLDIPGIRLWKDLK